MAIAGRCASSWTSCEPSLNSSAVKVAPPWLSAEDRRLLAEGERQAEAVEQLRHAAARNREAVERLTRRIAHLGTRGTAG